jgi:tetratricopeptide (TPR) repeat protein
MRITTPKSTTCACAYKGRGAAYLAKGDTNHAIEDYTKAIDFDSQAIQRDAKSVALGMIAVGNVRLSANYKRHYRTTTNHWICKRTMLIPATVALCLPKNG